MIVTVILMENIISVFVFYDVVECKTSFIANISSLVFSSKTIFNHFECNSIFLEEIKISL